MQGGLGNDRLTVTDEQAGDSGSQGQGYGIVTGNLNGGEGDDTLTVGGVLKATLTGGAGSDHFVLLAQQYRTLVEGTRSFSNSNGTNTAVTADPVLFTDFAAGTGGDVLDYSDMLRNGALSYDGSNPFGTGFLKLEQSGTDTLLSFDADGSAGTAEGLVVIARLQNVTASTLIAANFNPNYPPDGGAAVGQALTGSSLSESFNGGFGDDTINGMGGNDTIDGQAGSDVLNGGDGDDRIEGNFGNDTLYGGNGNDTLSDDQGSNLLDGGAGTDNLTSKSLSGHHTLLGGTGNDTLNATGSVVSLDGGDQDDSLSATGSLYQSGSNSYVQNGMATLIGGYGNDNLTVSQYTTSSIDGGDGNDYLNVYSGGESYTLYGTQPMSSTLVGGAGDDTLSASWLSSADLAGGDGTDNLNVYAVRAATLSGGAGTDTLSVSIDEGFSYYSDGNYSLNKSYTLDGGDDNDILSVSGRNQTSYGQTTVVLQGGQGNDRLTVTDEQAGDSGSQGQGSGIVTGNLNGGEGDDTLTVGGVLKATLTGGAGLDHFELTAQQYRTLVEGTRSFSNSNGTNTVVTADTVTITDFAAGTGGDVLDYSDILRNGALSYDGSNPFGTGFLKLEQSGTDTLLSFDVDGSAGTAEGLVVIARLQNVTVSTLIAVNFNPNFDLPGGVTPPDTTAPTLTSSTPSDAATSVAVGSNIVLTFNEAIQRGSGAIAIHAGSANGTVVESYDAATSTSLTIAGSTLTINPAADLAKGTHYFVTFENGNVTDLAGNHYVGTNTYDFTTEALPSVLHDLTGNITFWKTAAPIAGVTSSLTSVPAVTATQPIEFRNIHLAADGSRTIEIWETSSKIDIGNVDLDITLPTGSMATWQDATGLPSGWTSVTNTENPGKFILGSMGVTALSSGSVQLGTLTFTAPTNPQHFELLLSTGLLGNDTIPAFGISSDSTTTALDGLYQHSNMPDGTYALTSAKISGTAESNAIKSNDALAALKIAVSMNPNSDGSAVLPYQYLAADVNHDGVIKAADALNILKMAVKLSTAPEKEWLFVPESVGSETLMSRTNVLWPVNPVPVTLDGNQDLHLIGVLSGDVNGSWVA